MYAMLEEVKMQSDSIIKKNDEIDELTPKVRIILIKR